jgi:beta-lactamase regulating signal transducer with metallopeptidase domain
VVREITWQSWLLLLWLAIVFWQVTRLAVQRIQLSRLLRRAMPADSGVARAVDDAAEKLRLRQQPTTVFTDVDCSPFVCGLCRPVLVLPRSVAASLSPDQLRQVLLHELAHVKRHDLVWSWLPEIARSIYFFHPIIHWVSYRIRLERELACDQLAMTASGTTAADYAATLVQVVSHTSQPVVLKADGRRLLEREMQQGVAK